MTEKIERGALGAEQAARFALDRHQRGPGGHSVAVAGMGGKLDLGVELAERRFDQRQTADHPGLARGHHGAPEDP